MSDAQAGMAPASDFAPRSTARADVPSPAGSLLARARARNRALRRWVASRAVRLVVRSLFRLEVHGLDHLPAGNCLIVANHLSHFDPLCVIAALPQPERLRLVGDQAVIFAQPWQEALIRGSGLVIPLRRGESDREALRRAVAALEAGWNVVVFAEGRLGPQELDLLPFQRGIAFLAQRSGHPIVPLAIAGTTVIYRRKRIQIRIGPPLPPPTSRSREAAIALTTACEQAVRALLPRQLPPDPKHRPWSWLRRLV